MSDAPKPLAVLYGARGLTPWTEAQEKELRESLEEALRDSERVLIVGVRRAPHDPGVTQTVYTHHYREGRTSASEWLGELHLLLRHFEDECSGYHDAEET